MSDSRGRGRGRAPSRVVPAGQGPGRSGPGKVDEKLRREAILDLSKYIDQRVRVKFTGGREVTGTLKGYDQLLNLVMDDIEEVLRDVNNVSSSPSQVRPLGLAVLRGTSLVVINPVNGSESIANPFLEEA